MRPRHATVLAAVGALLSCFPAWSGDLKTDLIEKVSMYKVAVGRFAPIYPALAKQMVQDYGVTKGIAVDVGSGTSHLSMEYARATGCTVYALDIDPDSVRLSSILIDEAGLRGRVVPLEGDAQDMPFRDEFADIVFSRGSVPFWPDREAGLRECYRVLKPGGVAYVGGGFSRILDPAIRNPLAEERKRGQREGDISGFQSPADLDQVALRAGIPADQCKMHNEPIAGWWLEIRKPADHSVWYRRWTSSLLPWHRQMAQQIAQRYDLKHGRALELGWGAGSLSLPLAAITHLDLCVAGYDADAAKVANERARAAGLTGRIQAVACNPEHLIFDNNTFDYVFGHAGPAVWANPPRVLREIARVLKPRGVALIGNGVPIQCDKESEKQFRTLAKQLREAPDAPPDGFKQCSERETFEDWIAQSGANARVISTSDVHNQWVEIRK